MKETSYIALACLEAKPGKEQELQTALMTLVEPTRKEEGCLQYIFHQNSNDSSQFMFYEKWANQEAFKNHAKTPHMQAWQEKKNDLLAKPVALTAWEEIG